jgi:mannose-1-phosphate guanylyltransferase
MVDRAPDLRNGMAMSVITHVILSGGSGTRLWPMSTPDAPKQFLPLTDARTMFQLTAARVSNSTRFARPIIVANGRHADLIEAQLREISIAAAAIILEPCARNTAPAIALAALEAGSDAALLVMPSDHVITDEASFHAAIATALPHVEAGWLATFGIAPTGPETGYGYLRVGESIGAGVHRVAQFREKPDLASAQAMLSNGDHVWNGGIFLFRAKDYLDALASHAPAILAAATKSAERAIRDGARVHPDADAFAASPSDSIDYAVMEKADRVAVVPVSMGWSDVGSWDALFELGAKDEARNSVIGDVRLASGTGNLIRTDGIRISASGVDDLIIIASGNEVLILPRGQSQNVKKFSS